MYRFLYTHRVRYRECDPMNVVYHAHYLDYFEAGRTEALRHLGIAYKSLEESGIIMPVVEAYIAYRGAAYYDDLLEITCIVDRVPQTRIRTDYEVRRHGEDTLLTTGHVVLCFIDRERRRPVAAPENIRAAFERAISESA